MRLSRLKRPGYAASVSLVGRNCNKSVAKTTFFGNKYCKIAHFPWISAVLKLDYNANQIIIAPRRSLGAFIYAGF